MDLKEAVELKRTILEDNDADADRLRAELDEKGIYYVNVMSSPGSGKTTLLVKLISALKDKISVGVMEADIDGDPDVHRIREAGADGIQLHTGGMCHLDADMSRQGFNAFKTSAKLVFLENIGNLVCPAEFDTGAHLNIALLSIPEGDDKPLKYTLMFSTCDVVVLTKTDTAKYFDFDTDECRQRVLAMNPNACVFLTSAKTGDGIAELAEFIYARCREKFGDAL